MHVLIFGGSAFLGRHLVARLFEDDANEVTVFDLNPYEGPHADRVHWSIGDITKPRDISRALRDAQPDAIVCMVTPNLMSASEAAFEAINVRGIRNVLDVAPKHGVRACVYISSIAVMNHFADHVDLDESAPLPAMSEYKSPYDRTKRIGEDLALAADDVGGMRTCALRMGGILSHMNDVCLKLLVKPPMVIMGQGAPIDMLYGGNAAHAIALALEALIERPEEVGGEAMFVTKGEPTRNDEYSMMVANKLGRRAYLMPNGVKNALMGVLRIQHRMQTALGKPTPGIPLHDFLCIQDYVQTFSNAKAARLINYAPRWTLEEGIERIVAEHRG